MSKKKPLKAVKVLNPYPSEKFSRKVRKATKSVIDIGHIRRELEHRLEQLICEFPRFANELNHAIAECKDPKLSKAVGVAMLNYIKSKYAPTDEDWKRRCKEMESKERGKGRKKPPKRKPKPPQDEDRA